MPLHPSDSPSPALARAPLVTGSSLLSPTVGRDVQCGSWGAGPWPTRLLGRPACGHLLSHPELFPWTLPSGARGACGEPCRPLVFRAGILDPSPVLQDSLPAQDFSKCSAESTACLGLGRGSVLSQPLCHPCLVPSQPLCHPCLAGSSSRGPPAPDQLQCLLLLWAPVPSPFHSPDPHSTCQDLSVFVILQGPLPKHGAWHLVVSH